MKTTVQLLTFILCWLPFAGHASDSAVAAGWKAELAAVQQATLQDAGGRVRAQVILDEVLAAAATGLPASLQSGRPAESIPAGANRDAASAQGACHALAALYPQARPAFVARLDKSLAEIEGSADAIDAGKAWGDHVAQVILAEQGDAVFLNSGTFAPRTAAPATATVVPPARAEQAALATGRYRFTILAGAPGARGYVDGIGSAARFDNPGAIAVDESGNAYVTERDAGTVRKITPAGVVTTLAGTAGLKGSDDGRGEAARFNQPTGLVVDGAGNVYVADSQNRTVRKIDPSGQVTTVAGLAGKSGHVDGPRGSALFTEPVYVAVDGEGNLFVSDYTWIRKVTPDGSVSTLRFDSGYNPAPVAGLVPRPTQLRVDHAGSLYVIVSDWWDFSDVVKYTPTPAGTYSLKTFLPDPRIVPVVEYPYGWADGLAFDPAGNLVVAYSFNPVVVFTPTGEMQGRGVVGSVTDVDGADLAIDARGTLFVLPGSNWWSSDGTVRIGLFEADTGGPVIFGHPASLASPAGQRAEFKVAVTGMAPFAYQWYFNANPINGAVQSTLALENVAEANAGTYYVVVTNAAGSATSEKANLTVTAPPPLPAGTPTTPPGDVNSAGGGSVSAGFLAGLGALVAARQLRRRGASRPFR